MNESSEESDQHNSSKEMTEKTKQPKLKQLSELKLPTPTPLNSTESAKNIYAPVDLSKRKKKSLRV